MAVTLGLPPEVPRLLFVHAHPDDESLTTGGTIAHYTSRGAQVHVVTCTLGEEGEVLENRYRLLAAGHADQLGGYRIGELIKALRALGVDEPIHLGGAGRWRDSCMPPNPRGHQTSFVDAGDDAVDELVAIIDRVRPHVVVTYDPEGGYGHPDHLQAHRITTAAVRASKWRVAKLYWTVLASGAVRTALDNLTDVPSSWRRVPELADMGFCRPDSDIDAVIDAAEHMHAKVAALAAHATQVVLAPDRRCFALSNGVALPLLSDEHYILAAGIAGPRDGRGWETDLLAGLRLG
ncbi:MAG: 1D-myo-inositol 2-acetamido-2-deoxy-alpha-D-glucopyranoside deacetylase [Mycobacterium sp.]|jgi:N-acetyl-1-D-myo-inositol-2-amino-2-deoxy-alpha-D-glucopyranoside deacetylase|nr:1D-myo-inositol 2-acetamido-2-deoxy-alpha-D-glucopyranoside deacetylase [Mycobacterium sp.]